MSTTDAAPPLSTPLVVGVDLGGTKMAAALVTADGALAGPLASVPTPARSGQIGRASGWVRVLTSRLMSGVAG